MSTPLRIEDDARPRRMEGFDASELYRRLQEQIQQHPYRTLALAAGLGFALGGGLLRGATGKLVAAGLRVGLASAAAPLAKHFIDQIRGHHDAAN